VTALFKKQMTLEDRITSDTNYFYRIQATVKFANASYEPHYAVAESSGVRRKFLWGGFHSVA